MDIDRDELDLAELAKEAGVTPRTIRYYVQQGLLPTPGRGPGARYDRATVDRLQLIKLLQRRHQPLAVIRERLEELDDDGVQRALGSPPELPLSDSALSYVQAALKYEPRLVAAPAPIASPTQTEWQVTKSTWERVRLSRDVELNIRRPLSRLQNKQVDDLIEAARKIFSEDR